MLEAWAAELTLSTTMPLTVKEPPLVANTYESENARGKAMADVEAFNTSVGAAVDAIRIDAKKQAVWSARKAGIEDFRQGRWLARSRTGRENQGAGKRSIHHLSGEADSKKAGSSVHRS
jgi:hypothetical protein